jgi:hypothetical protein
MKLAASAGKNIVLSNREIRLLRSEKQKDKERHRETKKDKERHRETKKDKERQRKT